MTGAPMAAASDPLRGWLQTGLAQHRAGDMDAAEALYRKVLGRDPRHVEANSLLGALLLQRGRPEEAERHLRAALKRAPGHFVALGNLGRLVHDRGDRQGAIGLYRRALAAKPDHPDTLNNLGCALREQGELEQARAVLEALVAQRPELASALYNLALVHLDRDDVEAARPCLERCLALAPERVDANLALAKVHVLSGRPTAAEEALRRILAHDPAHLEAQENLGTMLVKQGRSREALEVLDRLLAQAPDNAPAHWQRGLALLALGRLAEGWREYDWGMDIRGRALAVRYPYPIWHGEDLAGKTLLVYAEQGVGDEALFASCLPDVARLAERCIVQCDPRLAPLIARRLPQAVVHGGERDEDPGWLDGLGPIAMQSPLASLPRYLRTDLATFPLHNAYLAPDPRRVAFWRERLEALGPGLKVGIAWRSRLTGPTRRATYPALDHWDAVLKTPGVSFVKLQYDDCAAELAQVREGLGVTVHAFDDLDLFDDLDDTAALLAALDLVITPRIATFALAGGVGAPTWVLMAHARDFLPLGTDHIPWLPQARAFRQPRPGDWAAVMATVAADLRGVVDGSLAATRLPTAAHEHLKAAAALLESGESEAALARLEAALAQGADDPPLHFRVAEVYLNRGETTRAAAHYRRVLAGDLDNPKAHLAVGHDLVQRGELDAGLTHLQATLARAPDLPEALGLCGNVHYLRGEHAAAEAYLDRAIGLRPGLPGLHTTRAMLRLAQGRLAEGWEDWDWRLREERARDDGKAAGNAPLWDGADLAGKTLLVHGEQGVGDEILFASCLPDLAGRVGRCVVHCDPRLAPIYQRSFPEFTVHGGPRDEDASWLAGLGPIHARCPIGTLPRYLRPTLAHFPRRHAFLTADPARRAHWRERLRALGPGLKVGLAWRSHRATGQRRGLFPYLEACDPLLAVPGLVLINLQYDDCAAEIAAARARTGVTIRRFPDLDLFDDLDDSLALMAELDVVVSPAISTHALAGAVGTRTLALYPAGLGWSLLGTDRLPWLPSVEVFRQERADDWSAPVAWAAARLRELSHAAPHQRTTRMAETRYGVMMFHSDDQPLAPSLERYGEYLEAEVALLRELAGKARVVLDVAAHCGEVSIPLARALPPNGRLIALEPDRLAFQVLCGNAALNTLENVYVYPVQAVARAVDPVPGTLSVDELTLEHLDLLRIGAGADPAAVLAGAEQTLRRLRPFVYVEGGGQEAGAAPLTALGYQPMPHRVPLFNPGNARGMAENLLGDAELDNCLWYPGL